MRYNDNPFKLLEVSPADGRREIVRQAEEKALLIDSQKCSEARIILTNPQRRIDAEIHWFLDCNADEVREIDEYITATINGNLTEDISWDNYSALTQLNILLACMDVQNYNNTATARYYILGISRLFNAVDAGDVLEMINENRRQAGLPEVTKRLDVESALNEMRSEIRQSLSSRLQGLSEELYTRIVTLLSESYSGSQRYKGHAVLEDVISEYQLYINDTLHNNGQAIIKTAKFIEMGASKINVSKAVSDLIDRLYAWDKLAQPLQLGALTKGTTHEESEEILRSLRELSLKLHNDYGFSSESLAITKAIQEVFMELPEFTELLSDDNKTLTKLVEEKEANEILSPAIESLDAIFEELKICPVRQRAQKIEELINKIKEINSQIVRNYSDKTSADTLRSSLGIHARSFAIDLHNDHEMTEEALKLISVIEIVFSDLPDVSEKLRQDKKALLEVKHDKDTADKILKGLKDIEASAELVKTSLPGERAGKINALLSKMVDLDRLIMSGVDDVETRNQLRERVAYIVRSAGIELHNTKNDSEGSLQIVTAVNDEFSDVPGIGAVLANDINTLNKQLIIQRAAASRKRVQEESEKSKRIVWGVIAGIILLVIIFGGSCGSNSSSNKSTSSSSSSSTSYSSSTTKPKTTTPTPRPTLTPQTMPANGKVFYCSTTDRPSSFKVTNNGSSNYYMKFVKAGTNTKVITFFVRAYSTVEIDMPAGNLELRYAYGSSWYGESKLFGENTRYAKDEEYYDFTRYSWEISLYTSSNSGQTMDVESIDASDF